MGFLKNQFSSVIEWNENGAAFCFISFRIRRSRKAPV